MQRQPGLRIFLWGCFLTVLYARVIVSCAPADQVLSVFWLWLAFGMALALWVAIFYGEAG